MIHNDQVKNLAQAIIRHGVRHKELVTFIFKVLTFFNLLKAMETR